MVLGVLVLAIVSGTLSGGAALYLGASVWIVLAAYSVTGVTVMLGLLAMAALCDLIGQGSEHKGNADLAGAQLFKGALGGYLQRIANVFIC